MGIILKWTLKKWEWKARNELLWFSLGQVVEACEFCNEPWGSIKCGEFLDYMRTC
jgi:hypothetical protein